ncbi:hypothetical protein AB0B28_03690 [Glycomyces sp. NPDC046736]|uniref:hypothetical protein n=1 Tax=Glycomyces sp. NPDC046736 TaxID=3155615 RepID=UPI0033DA9AC9
MSAPSRGSRCVVSVQLPTRAANSPSTAAAARAASAGGLEALVSGGALAAVMAFLFVVVAGHVRAGRPSASAEVRAPPSA